MTFIISFHHTEIMVRAVVVVAAVTEVAVADVVEGVVVVALLVEDLELVVQLSFLAKR